ncbi:hypothetical protein JVU11DRAFT_6925 [Chiua virens]|nr:hypothetical protein JVU11DRAFT_6925 [Chiua virens]
MSAPVHRSTRSATKNATAPKASASTPEPTASGAPSGNQESSQHSTRRRKHASSATPIDTQVQVKGKRTKTKKPTVKHLSQLVQLPQSNSQAAPVLRLVPEQVEPLNHVGQQHHNGAATEELDGWDHSSNGFQTLHSSEEELQLPTAYIRVRDIRRQKAALTSGVTSTQLPPLEARLPTAEDQEDHDSTKSILEGGDDHSSVAPSDDEPVGVVASQIATEAPMWTTSADQHRRTLAAHVQKEPTAMRLRASESEPSTRSQAPAMQRSQTRAGRRVTQLRQ